MIAVQSVLLGFTASNCIVFAEYFLFALKRDTTQIETKFLATGLLTAIVFMHGCFLKTGIFIQNCLGWFKVALVLLMVFTSLFTVFFRTNDVESKLVLPTLKRDYIWDGVPSSSHLLS